MTDAAQPTNRAALGCALVLASAVTFSLAGTLTKAIAADAWVILCWRGLIGAAAMAAYVIWCDGGFSSFRARLGWRGWLLATIGAVGSIAFLWAFKLTYVANVAAIYATVPFLAAVLEWLVRSEKIKRATMLASCGALFGVLIIVGGGLGGGHLLGDALALVMTSMMALYMVLIRAFASTPAVLAGAASALQLFVLGWLISTPLDVSARDAVLLLAFGLSFAVSLILLTEGTRLIPAADAGVIGSAEVPFAILFAWILLAELPPLASLIGGSIVLCAVTLPAWRARQN